MTERIPQSTAKLVVFKAYLASDHVTEATGKTIAITISKNGGAFGNPAAGATNATEISSGWYKVSLGTGDTDTVGPLAVRGAVATIDDVGILLEVAKATNAGFTGVPDAVAGASGGLPLSADASGRVDVLKINGTSQTARDIGASVLLSNGTGAGQLKLASGYVAMTWADIAAPTTTVNLSGTTIATTQKVDVETIKTNPVVNGGTVTFPADATLASTTNITAGTVTTATNVTNVSAGGIVAASFAANAITAAKLDPDVTTELQAGLATSAALAVVDGIVDDILLDTAEIGAAGAGLTNINLPNQTMDIIGNITGNLSGTVGSVTGAVGSVTGNVGGTINGLTATALKDFFDTDSTTTYASAVAGSVVKEIADNAGGASLSVQDIVDGVWDEDATGHQTQGSFGQAIGDPAADTNTIYAAVVTGAAGATVAADIIAVKAETAAIVADTNELQVDWANGGRLDNILDARSSQTSVDDLPTNAELATALAGADDVVLSAVAALTAPDNAGIAAIKTQTDKFVFTVANNLNVNVRYVNSVAVGGVGTSGNPWGPA